MPFITITYPPKYPLTESEKKWLEERETRICKFCIHCPGYLHTSPCLDWWGDTCVVDTMLEEFRDAAEFEARVAARLATMICDRFCADILNNKVCCRGHDDRSGMYVCRLKRARLAVEEEMEGCTK